MLICQIKKIYKIQSFKIHQIIKLKKKEEKNIKDQNIKINFKISLIKKFHIIKKYKKIEVIVMKILLTIYN